MQRFPWRFAVYLAAALYLFADMVVWHGPLHQRLTRPWSDKMAAGGPAEAVAMVYGRPITRLELAEALRAYLWRRGEDWLQLGAQARELARTVVLEQLINDRIVRAFRVMNRLDNPVPEALAAREVALHEKQFDEPGERERRLQAQALTAEEFEQEAREALADEAWIEEKIQHRLEEITDALAREWFDLHREEMTVPERFRAAHVFLSAHDPEKPERAAEVALLEAKLAGADAAEFARLAAEHSEDERTRHRGGDLGWFSAERMPEDFVDAVRAAAPGVTGSVVKTKLGWHWLRVAERQPARLPAYAEVEGEIKAHLETERRALAVKALLGELRVRSIKPARFLHVFADAARTVEPAELE